MRVNCQILFRLSSTSSRRTRIVTSAFVYIDNTTTTTEYYSEFSQFNIDLTVFQRIIIYYNQMCGLMTDLLIIFQIK